MVLRPRARSPLRTALLAVGAGGLALGAVEVALVLAAGTAGPQWAGVLLTVVAWVYVGAGLLAWWRRPANRMGPLIVGGGAAVLAAGLAGTGVPALEATGAVLATLCLAVVVHLLHAFPSGRLRGTASRVTVAVGYAVSLVLQAPLYLFTAAPGNVLAVADRPDLAASGYAVQAAAGAAVMVATTVVLAGRLRRADRARRRVLAPVYGYGIGAVLFIPLSAQVLTPLLQLSPSQLGVAQVVVLCGIPVAFTLGVLRGGFAPTGEIEELGTWLSRPDGARPRLTAALARTLGDDSLRMLFWAPEPGGYVDGDGVPAALPALGTDRAVVEFDVEGRRIGAIEYDATLIADAEPVRAAGRVAAIALAHERLTADLRAREEELRRSRLRIVEAGDRERRRIARNLHDGLQMRMVLLAMRAQQLAADASDPVRRAATDLRAGIDDAAAELRTLVHEVMPAGLVEQGLRAAVEDLVDRVPLRTRLDVRLTDGALPPAVEATAYFVVAEALTNALKHAAAGEVAVRLHHGEHLVVEVTDDGAGGAHRDGGSGLAGLADRVDSLGGRFALDSPPGGGTRLRVELPCGS